MDKNVFFNEILVPEFLKPYFEKEDWYLLPKDLKQIVEQEITEASIVLADNVKVTGSVCCGKNVKIGSFVIIEGPVYIGDDVEIGPFSWIRPGSIISNLCSIASHSQIKNSVMMERSKVSNHASLLDSILGSRGRIGGCAETMNRRFDQANINIEFGSEQINSGLDKYGAIIGEGARIGGNSSLVPGVTVGKNTFVSAGIVLNEAVGENKYVKHKHKIEIVDNKFDGVQHSRSGFFQEERRKD